MKPLKSSWKFGIAVAAAFVVLQFVRPRILSGPAPAEIQVPPHINQILERSCYSCHSNQRRLAWFDEIQPGYWLVRHDILSAREHLNFSTLGSKPVAQQEAALYESVNMIQSGAMPLLSFRKLHPEATVTPEELVTLKAYLAPWTSVPSHRDAAPSALPGGAAARVSLTMVQPEPSGFLFDRAFEGWKLISTTDRGDNNTFRFILGNDIAVNAAQSGNISHWPDGTRFAKIAWQQELGADGLVHPSKFVQVELMLKDAGRYKDTDGWGWGRWRGLDLKPYGKDACFVTECTTCHMPVRGNDYVYTQPITPTKVAGNEVVNNNAAKLPTSLPYQPLGWSAITMYVDPRNHTTATLYGNDVAMQAARQRERPLGEIANAPQYSAGSVLALVTWSQRDDPHWFGARIPDVPLSVEFVQIRDNEQGNVYRDFTGMVLIEKQVAPIEIEQRIGLIMGLAPVQLP